MHKILIAEDDRTTSKTLEALLRREGYQTESAHDGKRTLELWRVFRPDLIILNLGLPDITGLEVLKHIRAEDNNTPVVILTSHTEEVDELLGLGFGADDYITKPFSPRKLLAHLKAVSRRRETVGEIPKPLRVGPVEVDAYLISARVRDKTLDLTPTEFKILHYLAKTPGRAISRRELSNASLSDNGSLVRAVDSHVKNLRHKLSNVGAPNLIQTVWGVGYRMTQQDKLP